MRSMKVENYEIGSLFCSVFVGGSVFVMVFSIVSRRSDKFRACFNVLSVDVGLQCFANNPSITGSTLFD